MRGGSSLLKSAVWPGLTVLVLLSACSPASPPRADEANGAGAVAQRGSKTLIVGSGREHVDMNTYGNADQDAEVTDLVAAGLFRQNALTGNADPWLAEGAPSRDRGTWIVNADGTMVTTYHLRPGIKWHDGTPVRADQFVMGWEMARDRKWGHESPEVAQALSGIETPDDRTLILHWNRPFNRANAVFRSRLEPLPTHILEEVYQSGDVERWRSLPHWTSEAFVGTGPFRIVSWDPSRELELQAFDDYFLGRPKIDRIVWRFIFDLNTMLANVLSNNVDAALRQAFSVDTGLVARNQWEAREGTMSFTPVTLDWVNLSAFNPWLTDIRVRRALLYAIDRQAIIETVSQGMEPVAHIPISPRVPEYERAIAAATNYDYSPQRAQQLMEQAGWTAGADGALVNGRGERFDIDGRALAQQQEQQKQAVTADYWKRLGVSVSINNMNARELNAQENRGRHTGAYWGWTNMDVEQWQRYYSSANIPTDENRWTGNNTARWDDATKRRR